MDAARVGNAANGNEPTPREDTSATGAGDPQVAPTPWPPAGAHRVFEVRRPVAGFRPGDLLYVVDDVEPEGGELVIDRHGRVGRHGGGPVLGIVVAALRGT